MNKSYLLGAVSAATIGMLVNTAQAQIITYTFDNANFSGFYTFDRSNAKTIDSTSDVDGGHTRVVGWNVSVIDLSL